MDNTSHCLCHKPLEVSRTRLHQHSGGTGSAPASYLLQLAGGCVALGTSTSSGAGGPWYNYQGGYITGTASGHQWAPDPFVHLSICVCVCERASVYVHERACVCVIQYRSSLVNKTPATCDHFTYGACVLVV